MKNQRGNRQTPRRDNGSQRTQRREEHPRDFVEARSPKIRHHRMKPPTQQQTLTEEQEILERAVICVNDAILAFTLGFRRRILTEALRRIPVEIAEAQAVEDTAMQDVLCGRRAGDLTRFPRVTYRMT